MRFVLSGINDQSKEDVFEVEISEKHISFKINGNHIIIGDNYEKIIQNINYYSNNYKNSKKFQDRPFFKYFNVYKNNICIENMIRAFAVSSSYLKWYETEVFSERNINFKIEIMNQSFYNNLLIDWTGDLDIQPQMFFIQKDLIDNNLQTIVSLYNLRLLQKFSLVHPQKIVFYYVPFEIPKINNLSIIGSYGIWHQIVKGINAAVLRLTGGK